MIKTKEELFIAELGGDPKEEIELTYGAKIKITDLLKKYHTEQLIIDGVSNQRELLIAFLEKLENTQDETIPTNTHEEIADKFLKGNL